jgi:hypothetical protein
MVAWISTYDPPAVPSYFYLGSDNAAANHAGGVFMEFSTYDVAMTAGEVLADYNTLLHAIEDGKRVFPIPFLWTKDGDNVVDNCDDSTRDNWAVVGGVPGTHSAETRIDGKVSPGWTGYGLWLSNFITNDLIRPGDVLFGDQQGTATGAGESGGEYNQQSVTAAGVTTWSTALTNLSLEALFGKDVYLFTRLYDAGANLTIAFALTANSTVTTQYHSVNTTTAFQLYKTETISVPDLSVRIPGATPGYNSPTIALKAQRSTGATANARVDYIIAMPRPCMSLVPGATAGGNPEGFSYTSKDNRALSKTTNDVSIGTLQNGGDKLELVPNQYNGLVSIIGNIGSAIAVAHTLTYERIYITPRWSVL